MTLPVFAVALAAPTLSSLPAQLGEPLLVNAATVAGTSRAVALDLNLDGTLDVVGDSTTYGRLATFLQDQGGEFAPGPRLFPISGTSGLGEISDLHAADLDGDGYRDLLVCDIENGRTVWMRAEGGANLLSAPIVISENTPDVHAAITGDMDGDGLDDIIVTATERRSILWFKNLGAGQYGVERTVTSNQYLSTAIDVIDVDGDGDLDLLTNSRLSGFDWFRNLGGGVFGPRIVLDYRMDSTREVFGGDLNGDGHTDFLGVGEDAATDDSLVVFLGDGAGNLINQRASLGLGAPAGARGVTLLDADNDGDLDIAFQPTDTSFAYGLRVLVNDGSGGFGTTQDWQSRERMERLEIVDLDGNGDLDILGASYASIEVVRRTAQGGFELGPQISHAAGGGRVVTHRDFTGDGILDFFFSGNQLRVLPGLGDGRYGLPIDSSEYLLMNPADGSVGDIDGDGILDVVGQGQLSTGSMDQMRWARGLGGGLFDLPQDIAPLIPTFAFTDYSLADLDGDGDLDLHGVYEFLGRTYWVENLGQGASWAYHPLVGFGRPSRTVAVDVNGDQLLDLVELGRPFVPTESVALHVNLGGSFAPAVTVLTGEQDLAKIDPADFNGDGLIDLAMIVYDPAPELSYLPNNGQGGFDAPVEIGELSTNEVRFERADWDDDGDVDILYFRANNELYWLENRGVGQTFAPTSLISSDASSTLANTNFVEYQGLFDVDGDGDLDPVNSERASSPVYGATSWLLGWRKNEREIGTAYCSAVANSTGAAGTLTALGTREAQANNLALVASELPTGVAGIMIASQDQGFTSMPGLSIGNLCLSGSISRFARPGEVLNSGSSGSFTLKLDLTDTPAPAGAVTVTAGETWHYQAWHRDVFQGGSSNFTTARSITFR